MKKIEIIRSSVRNNRTGKSQSNNPPVKISRARNRVMTDMSGVIARINEAAEWLRRQNDCYTILIKQTRNLGDTLHITPIARHYKTIYPNCKICFVTGHAYVDVHKLNPDFDKIVSINHTLDGRERIAIGKHMMELKGIDKILCPSIFPFGEVWPSHTWSYPVISHQYFSNGDIKPPESIKGGGKLRAPVSDEDRNFAKNFVKDHKKLIALEYHSYSHPVPWSTSQFERFVTLVGYLGYKCISIAGKNEGIINGTIDGRGISWRRTISLINECDYFLGIGSGNTMLAATTSAKILEVGVSESITMKNCGYADSVAFNGEEAVPDKVVEHIRGEQ